MPGNKRTLRKKQFKRKSKKNKKRKSKRNLRNNTRRRQQVGVPFGMIEVFTFWQRDDGNIRRILYYNPKKKEFAMTKAVTYLGSRPNAATTNSKLKSSSRLDTLVAKLNAVKERPRAPPLTASLMCWVVNKVHSLYNKDRAGRVDLTSLENEVEPKKSWDTCYELADFRAARERP